MKYLVTGAAGNLASQIIDELLNRGEEVLALDLAPAPSRAAGGASLGQIQWITADITDADRMRAIVSDFRPERIIHMASLLSVSSEAKRDLALRVNLDASIALMRLAADLGVSRFFYPSTGATYGGTLPDPLPEDYPQWPGNIYGVTKVAVERMGTYLTTKGELDFRSMRLPMVISPFAPEGAVSAYASHAFRAAVEQVGGEVLGGSSGDAGAVAGTPASGEFAFPVSPEVAISTIYVADVVAGVLGLLDASADALTQRVYNVHSFSPSAGDIADAICTRIPSFQFRFEPKEPNMSVLGSLPSVHIDERARADWGWNPRYQLDACADDMIRRIRTG